MHTHTPCLPCVQFAPARVSKHTPPACLVSNSRPPLFLPAHAPQYHRYPLDHRHDPNKAKCGHHNNLPRKHTPRYEFVAVMRGSSPDVLGCACHYCTDLGARDAFVQTQRSRSISHERIHGLRFSWGKMARPLRLICRCTGTLSEEGLGGFAGTCAGLQCPRVESTRASAS